jgi:hypothetical protein
MSVANPQPAVPKPKLRWFQFSLRTMLVVVTLFTIWCSLAKWNLLFAVITILLGIAGLIFFPFYLSGRWLIRSGNRLIGFGCIGSAALMAFPYVFYTTAKIVATVVLGPEPGDGNPDEFPAVVLLTGCGVIGLFVCASAVPFMAHYEEQGGLASEKSLLQEPENAGASQSEDMAQGFGGTITDAGMKNLQQALPKCKIEWEPPTKDERQSPAAPDQLR